MTLSARIGVDKFDYGAEEISDSQKRFWLLNELAGDRGVGNLGFFLRLRGRLEVKVLEEALFRLIEMHSSLRTSISMIGDRLVQAVSTQTDFVLPTFDLSTASNPESEMRTRLNAEMARSFDLEKGDLFRAFLYCLADDHFILILNAHHIVLDGLSFSLLFRDLASLYHALLSGSAAVPPNERLQYVECCRSGQLRLTEERAAQLQSNWAARLEGRSWVLDLPVDFPRPAQRSYRISSMQQGLPKTLLNEVAALAREANVTVFNVFLATFGFVLSKWARQDDFLIGVPVSGRRNRQHRDIVGCFVNTLPVPFALERHQSVLDFLKKSSARLSDAVNDQELPFEKIVGTVAPSHDLSRAPLVQATCNFFKVDVDAWTQLGFEAEFQQFHRPPHGQDICLSIEASGDRYTTYLEYATDLFSEDTADQILKSWFTVLETFKRDPNIGVEDVSLVGADGTRNLIEMSCGPKAPSPEHPLDQLFAAAVECHPDALAAISEKRHFTYRQLDEASNRLANRLRANGARHGDFVATLLPEGVDVVVAWLAIVKIGAAFIPLDVDWPANRVLSILGEWRCLVITDDGLKSSLALPDKIAILTDDLDAESEQFTPVSSNVEQPLYAIYTSGSTGSPKAVINVQAGILNRLSWMTREFGSLAASRALKTTRHIYDSAVWQIFWPLINGGAVVLIDVRNTTSLKLLETIQQERISIVDFVPSLFSSIQADLSESESERFPGVTSCFPDLSIVIFGGEEIGKSGVDWSLERSTARVVNLYGPTEVSIGCVFQEISTRHVGPIPIGRPIDNINAFILDGDLQPVPIGVRGELCLAGAGVALGYAAQPALTAERFVPNPFGNGDRLYRTGDLVKRQPDGAIVYLGRLDSQIKLNGVRIEPGEVEAAIKINCGAQEVSVCARVDSTGRKRLVAYVVIGPEKRFPEPSEFREALRSTLPLQLIPQAFVPITKIPLSPGGKLDFRALPEPNFEAITQFVPLKTKTEETIAAIWTELLGEARIGRRDNFFDRGGHSLMATRVIARVRDRCGVNLKLRDLFETEDLAALARRVDAAPKHSPLNPIRLLQSDGNGAVREAPLSYNQQQLWVIENLGYGGSAYNLTKVLRLKGALDAAALSLALTEIVRRHSALRTRFKNEGGVGAQIIDEPWPILLKSKPIEERHLQFELARLVDHPFKVNGDRLFRYELLSTAPDQHVLALIMHHINSDGWSMGILIDELVTLYGDLVAGRQSSVSSPLQYADYAIWQRQSLESAEIDRQIEFWKTQLIGAPPFLELPTDKPRPASMSLKGRIGRSVVPEDLATDANRIARRYGTTLFNVLLSSFQIVLSKWSGQTDLVIGTLNAGRSRHEVEQSIGYFVNMLALRSDLRTVTTFRDLVAQNTTRLLDIDAHRDITFDRVVEALRPPRHAGRQPVFQTLFALQNMPKFSGQLADLAIEEIEPERASSKLDLSVFVTPTSEGLEVAIEYATDLFEVETIERLTRRWFMVLGSCLSTPDISLDDIAIILPDEKEILLSAWAQVSSTADGQFCLHDIFSAQARRCPDAIALTDGQKQISYRELESRSDVVAAHLRALGMEQGAIVGLCVDRSAELVVGALGILKAGGAYLPLDPTYPTDRLEYMSNDASTRIVVTSERSRGVVPYFVSDVLVIEGLEPLPQLNSCLAKVQSMSPDLPAYVIYTSGSTGRPKGVLVSHRNVSRLLSSAQQRFGFDEKDVWTLFHSFSFDFSVWELWGAIAYGGRLVIVPYLVSRSPSDFATLLEAEGVTVLNQTPSAFSAMSEAIIASNRLLPALRFVIFGGEKLVIGGLKSWFKRFGDEHPKLINMYGITETTVHVTHRQITMADLNGEFESVIGRPLSDLQVFILDKSLNPVPVGTPGEMYIAGGGLSSGYLNQPALTAERFIPSPFAPPGRLYKTGDLARWRANGDIDYLGRIDQQIKLRGFRIELGEIEAALLSNPTVREAAVTLAGGGQDLWLAAYVVSTETDDEGLKACLRERLPDHMVPSTITFMDRLPLTVNGKLDRSSLPTSKLKRGGAASPSGTWTGTQKQVGRIISRALSSESVGLDENFFEIGGHSLLAIRVCAEIGVDLGIKIPVIQFFERPTVASLSSWIDSGVRHADSAGMITMRRSVNSNDAICFLPTALGTGIHFSDLARQLPHGAEILTCRLRGTGPGEQPCDTIEEMAAYCLEQIKQAATYDCWTLIGWSFGGVLAYEVARQMESAGLPTPRLILIDAFAVGNRSAPSDSHVEADEEVPFQRYLEKILETGDQLPQESTGASERNSLASSIDKDSLVHRDVFKHALRALRRYRPETFDGHVFEIRAETSVRELESDTAQIAALPARSRTIVELSGDHFSIMAEAKRPLVDTLEVMLSAN